MAPALGVKRGSPSGNGGYILNPSDTMAARYGSLFTLSGTISFSDEKVERISSIALFNGSGCLSNWKVMPARPEAVLSLPARTMSVELA